MSFNSNRIVITGMGPISSLGIGLNDTWSNALHQKTNIKENSYYWEDEFIDSYFIHSIKKFNINSSNIEKLKLEDIRNWKKGGIGGDLLLFLASIKLALEDSHLNYLPESNTIGLILTSESPGQGEFYEKFIRSGFKNFYNLANSYETKNKKKDVFKNIFNQFKYDCNDLQNFMNIFHVAKTFNIRGFSLFINNACSSGLYAMEIGAQLIKSKRCSAVIISAVDMPNIFKALWFKSLKLLSDDGVGRPFGKNANGFVMGEGGASFVLENYDSAIKRNAKIYAEYVYGAFNLENWKVTVPAVKESHYRKVISDVLMHAGVSIDQIDICLPHGVGTAVSDQFEINNISDVFKSRKNKLKVSAFKPYVGHNLGGCTLLETCLLILCMKNNVILPILNSKKFLKSKSIDYVCKKEFATMNIALKTCTPFAGFNGAIILKNEK